MKVSFSGIYDVRFPYGTKDEFIKQKAQETKAYMIEQGYTTLATLSRYILI